MTLLHWLLKALRRLFHSNALRSSLRAILYLWNILKIRLKKVNGTGGKSGKKVQDEPEPTIHILYNSRSERAVEVPCRPTAEPSVVVCPSQVPDSLHPYPSGSPNPSLSSHNLSTSLHPDIDISRPRTPPRSRIAYPNVAGQLHGTHNASRTSIAGHSQGGSSRSPSASGSRISLHDHNSRAHSPISFPASSRPASPEQVAIPIAQAPVPSHASASHVSTVGPPAARDDSPRITIRRETGAPAGGEQGYDIAITTSPVQEDISMAGNLSIIRSSPVPKRLSDIYSHFRPTIPESNDRYDGTAKVPTDRTEYPIEPLTTYFGREDPQGWRQIPHPEGARYFCYQEKNVYTDANILDERILGKVMNFITEIFGFCDEYGIRLPPAANLVLAPENGETTCAYYFVDHSRRSIFWLDHFMFSDSEFFACYTVRGVTDPSHIRHEIESQYWYHCNQYPHCLGITLVLVDELRDVIMHWIGDSLTSMTGTAPYSVAELQSMLSLANSFRKNTATGGCVSAYSRLMHIFCRHRFTHFHGQPAVRLDFDKSVHETPDYPMQSWLLKLLSPLMFSTPDIYYNALDRIWVDKMIHQASWEKFINGMKDEWQELILFGTVLLNANVAFLAIQSVDVDADGIPQRSPAQIGSYMSVVGTLGSIILGLFLARKHHVKPKESALDAAGFLDTWSPEEHGRSGVRIGLETLAILYSVPYALLMWGVILFLVGFSYMCFNDTNVAVRSLTGGAWLVTFIFVLWCILSLTSWHQAQRKSFWQSIFVYIRWVLFDLPKEIRSLSQRRFWDISSHGGKDTDSSQIRMNEMHEKVVESPQEMQDHDIPYPRPHSSSSNRAQGGHQSESGPMRHILSFFGRKRSSQDTARTVV